MLGPAENMGPKQFKVLVKGPLRNRFKRYWADGIKPKLGQLNKGGNNLITYGTFKGNR